MTSLVKADIIELDQLNTELKRLTSSCRDLRARAKMIEDRIIEYLKTNNQPGIRYNGTAILLENNSRRIRKTKTQKEEHLLEILQNHGISDPQPLVEKLCEAHKGNKIECDRIRFRKL